MGQELIDRRNRAVERVDKAIDEAWPQRTGEKYVHEMKWAVDELKTIADLMKAMNFNLIEQSRTYRLLGSFYADMEPALGKEMLNNARKAYQVAEALLENQSDDLERAKLNFNFANTLRFIDPDDTSLLQEAKKRLAAARSCFAVKAPQFLAQTDPAIQSVDALLMLAPLSKAVKINTEDMATLENKLKNGHNLNKVYEQIHEVMKRDGGPAGLAGQLQAIIETLPDELRQSDKLPDIQKKMNDLTNLINGNEEMAPDVKKVWSLLKERLKSDISGKEITTEHAATLNGILEEFKGVISGDEKDVSALLAKVQKMRGFIENRFEMAHYLSHGIGRPSANSRAARLVELNWKLRRYLLEEMNIPGKGEEESKEALELNISNSRVDKRIYEAGDDDSRCLTVEKEELRPHCVSVRDFSSRMSTMLAYPVWGVGKIKVDTNMVFYSGPEKDHGNISEICRLSGLEKMAEPKGERYANARWEQLQKSIIAVFDFRSKIVMDLAAVSYELGIALTLGKPIVILVEEGQTLPFDVEIYPVGLNGGKNDSVLISDALDQAVAWISPRPPDDSAIKTLKYVLSLYTRPQPDLYADQTLRILSGLDKTPDPLAISRTLGTLFNYLKDGRTHLIHPGWPAVYPEDSGLRLFHVMPYRPEWAQQICMLSREVTESSGVRYIRGDEMSEANIILSIWEEIAKADYILVDLTELNANVALELGIAHTLGKKILIVGQGDPNKYMFRSISKFRVHPYNINQPGNTLGIGLREFLSVD
jgi:hypothetical protein